MSEDRIEAILDAAYVCFTRFGVRRTTMEDIAGEVGTSRTAIYQYVRNTDDAFTRLADRLLRQAADAAQGAVDSHFTVTAQLSAALEVKLELTLRLWRDSPAHAAELIGTHARLSTESIAAYDAAMRSLLTKVARPLLSATRAREFAEILLAVTRGIEADLSDPAVSLRRLRRAVALLVAGLSATNQPHTAQ